nr:growth arrest specific protein 8 [Hymenolepis microstoma]
MKKSQPQKSRQSRTKQAPHVVEPSEMTRQELEKFVSRLQEELERERSERNKTALERDKITQFWEISKQQNEETCGLLRRKERELEDTEERQEMELQIYRQKAKHLMFEHNAKQSDAQQEATIFINAQTERARKEVKDILNENNTLKAQMRLKQLESEDIIKLLKSQHETEMTSLRQDFIQQAEELEQRLSKKEAQLRADLETQRACEIHATEERKNLHIKQLEMAHDKELNNMRTYYNDITLGNVNVIKTLKENIEELQFKLSTSERELEAYKTEIEEYKKKLNESEEQNKSLRKAAKLFESEFSAHNVTKADLRVAVKAKNSNEILYNIAQTRLEEAENEIKRMTEGVVTALLDIKKKSSLKCALLEKKLVQLVDILENMQTEIDALVASNADPSNANELRKNIEKVMKKKNTDIKGLQLQISRINKAYMDLWNVCQEKLSEESKSCLLGLDTKLQLKSPFDCPTELAKWLNVGSKTSEATNTAIKCTPNDK